MEIVQWFGATTGINSDLLEKLGIIIANFQPFIMKTIVSEFFNANSVFRFEHSELNQLRKI